MSSLGIAHFAVRPRWIPYSDFDQRPPIIEEITINDSPDHP